MTEAARRPWHALITLLSALVVSSAVFVSGYIVESKETQSAIAAWDLTVSQLYGATIEDFIPLGEEGIYFEWVDPGDSDLYCKNSESCNIIRLANVISCQHGFKIAYEFLDSRDDLLSKQLSRTTFVPVGHFTILEIDTANLPEGGTLFLSGAKCQSRFPAE